jgi:hypothetical protein
LVGGASPKATISCCAIASLRQFQKKLTDPGHFYTRYSSIDDLKLQFRDQLDKLADSGALTSGSHPRNP